ncbi:MAG TPA: MaoC family dehydratase [Thermodesulfobacteriota bacterium]
MTAPLEVGARAELTRTLTDADIRKFAEATGDTNPVHLDEAYAKGTVFGGRIAHGLLTAGLVSAVLANRLPGPGTVYLSQTLEFKAPVRPGDTVTAEVEVLEVTGRRARLATRCRLADGTLVLAGEAVVRLPR